MAIQAVNLGALPNGVGGDTPRSANTKINANFADPTHAASRLVGEGAGNVMPVGAFGLGGNSSSGISTMSNYRPNSFIATSPSTLGNSNDYALGLQINGAEQWQVYLTVGVTTGDFVVGHRADPSANLSWGKVWTSKNTTVDGSGFIKKASPVVDLHSDRIELNDDAKKQNITFEKLGKGDYLVKGSLGFAQEGWFIENPKDANGNVLVAVVYEQLANNDISVKTYAKKFDEETGDIIPNLSRPFEIREGRFISLRLHEEPKTEILMETPTEV